MDPFPKLILVPTDFSEMSAHALRYAAKLSSRTGAHLLVLHACGLDPASVSISVADASARLREDEFLEKANEDLLQHVEENVGTDVLFDVRVVGQPAAIAIVNAARESGCDLIVMGSHGRIGLSHFLFGSVTEEVVRSTKVPVIGVPARAQAHGYVGRVLCPVSFTPECREALRTAARLVENRSAPLVLLRQEITNDDLISLRDWIPPDLVDRCELKIVSLADSQRIARIADGTYTDLIVLSLPADRSLREVLGGTFAEHVIHESKCPVLLVKEATRSAAVPAAVAERLVQRQ